MKRRNIAPSPLVRKKKNLVNEFFCKKINKLSVKSKFGGIGPLNGDGLDDTRKLAKYFNGASEQKIVNYLRVKEDSIENSSREAMIKLSVQIFLSSLLGRL